MNSSNLSSNAAERESFQLWLSNEASNSTYMNQDTYAEIVQHLNNKEAKASDLPKSLRRRLLRNKYCLVNDPEIGVHNVLCVPSKWKTTLGYYRRVMVKEELYDVLYRLHAIEGKHCGYHKTYQRVIEIYSNIPRKAIREFIYRCSICHLQGQELHREPLKPIFSPEFLHRCQIDLVDMQSCPDGDYRYIAHYMDHFSKFHVIFGLKTKTAQEVADGLRKYVFSYFGLPKILQSDNGSEFVNRIVTKVVEDWPGQAKIIHGRPRHSQSQGLVEKGNHTLERMLKSKMAEVGSNHWEAWLPEVQYALNTQISDTTKKTPFEVVFGQLPNNLELMGIDDSNLEISEDLDLTEDQVKPSKLKEDIDQNGVTQEIFAFLHTSLKNGTLSALVENSVLLPKVSAYDTSNDDVAHKYAPNEGDDDLLETINEFVYKNYPHLCEPSRRNVDTMVQVSTSLLNTYKHTLNEKISPSKTISTSPTRQNIRAQVRKDSSKSIKRMINKYSKRIKIHKEFEVGEHVSVKVPRQDRATLDMRRLPCIIVGKTASKYPMYKLRSQIGVIKPRYPGSMLMKYPTEIKWDSSINEKEVSLREVARSVSVLGTDEKCNCRDNCAKSSCKCKKGNRTCGSKCHTYSKKRCKNVTIEDCPASSGLTYELPVLLTDIEIHKCQNLLKTHFPQINGFQDPVLKQLKMFRKIQGPYIQVLNVDGSHWVTITNLGSKSQSLVKLYDSLPKTAISNDILAQITSIQTTSAYAVAPMNTMAQLGGTDCGIYAIAYATDLCFGFEPVLKAYVQSQMREHLHKCLKTAKLIPFPSKDRHVEKLALEIKVMKNIQ